MKHLFKTDNLRKMLIVLSAAFLPLSVCPLQAQTDVTSSIKNPNFDGMSFSGWQQMGMWLQTNAEFSQKSNFAYAERWVSNTQQLPDSYIKQTLSSLPNGRYQLSAGALHVKQGSSTAATGAAIFADWQETTVTSANLYTLTFDVLAGNVTIGFKCENATGNWMACDNFKLSYIGNNVEYLRSGLSNMLTKARSLYSQSMASDVKSQLNSAISTASGLTTNGSSSAVTSAGATLKKAMLSAERSIFATKTSTTGTVPQVVTDPRYARGATMIFGRSTVTSSKAILEQGFCYSSTNATPTVADERTTRFVSNGGNIYCIDNVTPATLYYIRAYAVTPDYKVGYGDVVRVYTLPKGNIGWGYGNEGSAEQNARIGQAVEGGMNYWNELTSINGFYLSAHYAYGCGAGGGTAECSYGGYMSVSQTESYQATGTILHEAGHGIGVGTTGTYYGDIRENGNTGIWKGKRATRFLQFWDNSDNVRLTGDATHIWATNAVQSLSYAINGAFEDAHSDAQYYANSLLMQAMVEDGLFPINNQLQGLAYTLEHNDGEVMYIRNSDEGYGLKSDYLVDNGGVLQLKTLSNSEVQQSGNNAQWLLSFDPSKQAYRIKNKSTGRFICYSSDNAVNGFKATTSTSSEIDLRLQLSFVDAVLGDSQHSLTLDAYHIMRRNATASPQALCAMTTTTTGSTPFSNTISATSQRWVFLTEDGIAAADAVIRDAESNLLDQLIAKIRNLATQSHTEKASDADENLEQSLADIVSRKATADAATLTILVKEAKAALMTFLGNTIPEGNPYDITFLITNAGVDTPDGWSGTAPTVSYSCGEFYQRAFDCYQTLTGAPAGRYVFKLQGFQRPGAASDVYNDFVNGGSQYPITTQVYLGTTTANVCHIGKEARSSKLGIGSESEVGNPVKYVPNNMEAASAYFSRNMYENTVETTLPSGNQTLRLGIRGQSYVSSDWTIFDNFRLFYYGSTTESQDPASEVDGYDITTAMAPYLCTGSLKEWNNDGMVTNYNAGAAPYANSADGARVDFPFVERWVSSANNSTLDDTKLSQTITELPNGKYYIRASLIAVNQSSPSTEVTGVWFIAGDKRVKVATGDGMPERYSLAVEVTDGTLTYGLEAQGTNANWIAIDNLSLIYDGTEEEYLAQAQPCTPVRVPIGNPTFDGWNLDGWNLSGNWWTQTTTFDNIYPPFMESWVNATGLANMSAVQTLPLKEGYYTLQAAVEAVRQDQPTLAVSGVTLRLDDKQVECHTADGAPQIFSVGKQLPAGDHTLGIYVQSTNANWMAVDNFVLRYYGKQIPKRGDADNDGRVTVTDAMLLVSYILDDTQLKGYSCYFDLNGDEKVTVTDVMIIVDIILNE